MMNDAIYDHQVYANSTFDLDAIHNTYTDLQNKNFNILYSAQHALANVHRFSVKLKEFKQDKTVLDRYTKYHPRRFTYPVDFSFIHPDKRLNYRRSELFNTLVNHEVVTHHSDLFSYNYMVFVDGVLLNLCEIFPYEDQTIISIDISESTNIHGMPIDRYNELLEKDADVAIIFIPNYTVSMYSTNKYMYEAYPNGLNLTRGINISDISDKSVCFCTCDNDKSISYPIPYQMKDDNTAIFNINRDICDGSVYNMMWLNFHLVDGGVIEVDHTNPYFKLDEDMPVPTESMMIFTLDSENTIRFVHEIDIDIFYPNIYRVNNIADYDKVYVYYFYNNSTTLSVDTYENDLKLFHNYVDDVLKYYTDGTLPEFVLNYKSMVYDYGVNDYKGSIFYPNEKMSYKINKLQDYIDEDPNILSKYLSHRIYNTTKFYMDVSKMDLESKIRYNTYDDVDGTGVSFKEPHYVFIMRTQNLRHPDYHIKVFLDGYFLYGTNVTVLSDEDFFYIYIPCELVSSTSMIEINRLRSCKYEGSVMVNSTEFHTVNTREYMNKSLIHDIFLLDPENGKYIDRSMFSFQTTLDDGTVLDIESTSHIPVPEDLKIKVDESLVNRRLPLKIMNIAHHEMLNCIVDNNEYCKLSVKDRTYNSSQKYRLFKEGRLLPLHSYSSKPSDTYMGDIPILIRMDFDKDTELRLDYSPHGYQRAYYQKDIDPKGFVDLDGVLNKPINLKWYDIYLNGVKLHKNNIIIISPTKFTIKGINSTKHLEIIEHLRDGDILRLKHEFHESIDDKLWDSMDEIKDKILGDDIDDSLDDIIGGILDDLVGDRVELFEFYLKYTFINPNRKQLTQPIIERYKNILTEGNIMNVDSNIHQSNDIIHHIDANTGSDNMEQDTNRDIFEIGALQDRFAISPLNKNSRELALPGESMCNPITGEHLIKDERGIVVSGGEISRTYSHVNKIESAISLASHRYSEVITVVYESTDLPMIINYGDNILIEGPISIPDVREVTLSLDIDTLQIINNEKTLSHHVPNVQVVYKDGVMTKTVELPLSHLSSTPIKITSSVGTDISSIKLLRGTDKDQVMELVLHSILIAV